jgi:hypothetical protein
MSKVEAQRAMREARYAARNSATGTSRREVGAVVETPVARAAGTPATKPAPVADPAPTETAPDGQRCGHRSMNGRTCTRPASHREKSHRYS